MAARDSILAKVRSIPKLPTRASEVLELARDPDVPFDMLCRAVESDLALTVNVLRLANSAVFGAPRQVGSVRQALVRLGTKQLFELLLAAITAPRLQRPVPGYDLRKGELWRHSLGTAVCSVELAQSLGLKNDGSQFTAGLLADVGKIVLGNFVKTDREQIVRLAFDECLPFDEAERQVLGIDHAEVGAYLLDYWQLPRHLVEAARWHHQPERSTTDDRLARLVHAADALVMTLGLGTGADGLNYHVSSAVFHDWAINEATVDRVVGSVLEHSEMLDPCPAPSPS